MLRATTVITGYAGSPCYNNLYGSSDSRPQDLLNRVGAVWTALATIMGVNARIDINPVLQVVDEATGAITSTVTADPVDTISGSYAGEILPPATQGLIRMSTGTYVSGRELRGKLFVPYMPEGTNDGGTVNSGALGALNGAAEQLTFETGDIQRPVVWSKTHGRFETITSASAWSQFAVLRSRRD